MKHGSRPTSETNLNLELSARKNADQPMPLTEYVSWDTTLSAGKEHRIRRTRTKIGVRNEASNRVTNWRSSFPMTKVSSFAKKYGEPQKWRGMPQKAAA